jgi:hypothetical protein
VRHANPQPARQKLDANIPVPAVTERERAARHLPERDGVDAESVRACLESCDDPFDEIEGAGHGTQVDTFAGGAALNVCHVAEQGFLPVPPGVRPLLAGEDPTMHQAAEGRSVTGTSQVVIDGRAPHFVVEPVPEAVEKFLQIGGAEGADVLLMESYGDRHHDPGRAHAAFAAVLTRALARGRTVVIPAFAIDRTEVVLHELAALRQDGVLPRSVPVYVASPMALVALDVYREALRARSPEIRPEILDHGETAISPDPFLPARTVQESIDLNSTPGPAVIVSSAGIATGGRVLHHLHRLLPNPRNAVVIVGFAAARIRARDQARGSCPGPLTGTERLAPSDAAGLSRAPLPPVQGCE